MLALSFVTVAVVGPATQNAEAIPPLLVVGAAFVAGAACHYVYDWLTDDRDNAGITTYTAQDYCNNLGYSLNQADSFTDAYIGDITNNIDLMQYFFIRQAQWAARELYIAQEQANEAHVYDQYYVLNESTVPAQLLELYTSANRMYENIYEPYNEIGNTFTGNFENSKFGLYVRYSTSGNGYVFATPGEPYSKAEFTGVLNDEQFYYFNDSAVLGLRSSDSGREFRLLDTDGNKVYSHTTATHLSYEILEPGLPAGIYKVSSNSSTSYVFADAIPVLTSVQGVAFGFGVSAEPDINLQYHWSADSCPNGYVWTDNSGRYVNHRDGNNVADKAASMGFRVNLSPLPAETSHNVHANIAALTALLTKIKEITVNVNNFAQSYYNAIVASGDPGEDWGLPLMLMPDPSQIEGMDWMQLYALYIAYLQNAYAYYQENADDMNDALVNISGQSLKLKVRGAIVNQTGSLICDNTTVWTPYITTSNANLELGYNVWNQGGYVIKWGNCTDLANFTGGKTVGIVSLASGYEFWIQEMIYDGLAVSEVDLTVTTLRLTLVNGTTPPAPPDTLSDLDWIINHWYYLAIIGGVICLLGAIATRNMPILAAGLVLMAAGAIGWYLAGDTSLLSWLSMEPPNLRAWLQGLR